MEIVVVMALMAIAATMAVPNLNGILTRSKKNTYVSYLVQAKNDTTLFLTLMNMGDNFPYKDVDGTVKEVELKTPANLQFALNMINRRTGFIYYVMPFTDEAAKTNIQNENSEHNKIFKFFGDTNVQNENNKKNEIEDIIVILVKQNNQGIYSLRGFWYYNAKENSVKVTYNNANRQEPIISGWQSLG